jgi:hypothetical protein
MQFVDGELFETAFETSTGSVGFLAEVSLEGRTLHLKDVVVEPLVTGRPKIGSAEVLAARRNLMELARAAGFQKLRITGQRLTGANIGKRVDVMMDLE